MKIAGVSNFHVSSFTNIKPVKVVSMPERPKHTNNSVGGSYNSYTAGRATAEQLSEARKNIAAFHKNIIENAKKPDWVALAMPTILGPTGEPLPPVPPLYMNRFDAESAGLAIMSDVDIKI